MLVEEGESVSGEIVVLTLFLLPARDREGVGRAGIGDAYLGVVVISSSSVAHTLPHFASCSEEFVEINLGINCLSVYIFPKSF